jgi:tricorn protease
MRPTIAIAALLTFAAVTPGHAQVSARMFRQPDVSATSITFVYAGDIWVVPKSGGTAQRLTTPRGEESFPRFSPDGSRIAYTANYDGNQDVYVIPTAGGVPLRITHHPMADRLVDWYPDGGSLLIATSMASGRQRYSQFYRVSVSGGLPEKLPVPYGEFGAISPDGRYLAYMPMSQDFRTWKRYRGGWNPDIWLFDLQTYASENVTHNDANDAHPMWHGRTLYFLSDRDSSLRNNIWAYNLDTKETREVTHFTDYDITIPAIGPNDIVFQAGGRLYLLDLSNEQTHEVQVNVVTDLATLKPRVVRTDSLIQNWAISPTGQRAIFQARGDLFSLPAQHGPVMNLTQSSGVAERYPAWSPDGKQVAYWSDRSGEYELWVRAADGTGPERKLTSYGPGYRYQPYWSPDSRKLAFIDQSMRIWVFDLESGQTARVDKASWWYHGTLAGFRPSWSADSRWLAYDRDLADRAEQAIFLFDTRTGESSQVTSGYYNDQQPVFDPDGKYLYFLTNRTLRPVYSDIDNTWVYTNSTNIAAVTLRRDVPSPLATRDDEEGAKSDSAAAAPGAPKPAPAPQAPPPGRGRRATAGGGERDTTAMPAPAGGLQIDTAGFEQRLVVLPPAAGNYADLRAVQGKVVYRRLPVAGSADHKTPIVYYDLKEREEKTVFADAGRYEVSADGKKLLVASSGQMAIIDLKPDQKLEHPLRTAEMEGTVDPRAEWHQIFNDVWRIYRDYFYDPNMHGVNWNQMRDRYGRLIDDAVTRWDVNFVIGELISELNSSHTYRSGGDLEAESQLGVGLLGVDWTLEHGAYRIARIIDGAPWDNEVRSPLEEPGVNVHAGDYVLAVNGVPLDTAADPWAAFAGLANHPVELMVNGRPTMQGARKVVVQTLSDETRLRNLAWIEANRRFVDSVSGGRVGYIYVPSTGIDGQTELERQLQFQFTKEALVIDERWNSGGQIPDRFIELLSRPPLAFWAVRDGHDWQFPPMAHFGPKVMLINGWSGSGGDAFPYYFREAKLGPLVGMRTWGGLIGITGAPTLVDGGSISVPTFRQYSPTGEWFPEGHGVEPDISVVDDPTQLARGLDPQLQRGVQEALRQLGEKPFVWPRRPPIENRWRP